MTRVIRHVKTGGYFRKGEWTEDSNQAEQFEDAGKVIETCLRYHLSDVELVLHTHGEAMEAFDTHVKLFDYGLPA